MVAKPPAKKKLAKVFRCTACAAPIHLRAPGFTLVIVCEYCKTKMDARDENYKILESYKEKTPFQPLIKLGTRGKLLGHKWEVIGFLVRCDKTTVYKWHEYLLFNPLHGFRWLVLNEGHWSFVKQIRGRINDSGTLKYGGNTYKQFLTDTAEVLYVVGEFYWQVKVGSKVTMIDYISPPYMLSLEIEAKEKSWSLGTYIEPQKVEEAFGISTFDMPIPRGVGPNQPSPHKGKVSKLLPSTILAIILVWFVNTATKSREASNFLFTAILVSAPLIGVWFAHNSAEVKRWENSDFPLTDED